MELEGTSSAVSPVTAGPPAAEARLQAADLREASLLLMEHGHFGLAGLLISLMMVQRHRPPHLRLRDAMWVLNGDEDDELGGDGGAGFVGGDPVVFAELRRSVNAQVRNSLEAGYDERLVSEMVFPHLLVRATLQAAGLIAPDIIDNDGTTQPYRNGGFGAVPASAAAVHSLEKQTFRAGADQVMECSICVEEFVDGEQVSVMPCPSRGHRFHPDCIAKWLGISNMCPLCRHGLPAC